MKFLRFLALFLFSAPALAAPAYMFDAFGNPIGSTAGALNIAGSFTALVGATYNVVPPVLADGDQVSLQADVNGRLLVSKTMVDLTDVGGAPIALGQTTMASSLPVTLASNQSALSTTNLSIGVTGAAVPADATFVGFKDASGNLSSPLLDTSFYLDTDLQKIGGAAYALGQTTMSASAPVTIASDQSTLNTKDASDGPVTPGAVAANSILGGIQYNTAAPAPTNGQQVAMQADASGNLLVDVKAGTITSTTAPNTNASFAQSTTLDGVTAQTFTAPANAVAFVIETSSSNTVNVRYALGAVATTTAGMRLEPGRSEYIPVDKDISVIAESSTNQEVDVTWVLSN